MASEKRCHYEVLGLHRDCTPDEIRSAYRRLALQRHPDKLVKSGLSQAEATAQFQELQQAYEVLSDPKERAWYDSHRSQILFSDPNSVGNSVPNSFIPNLFSFFSNTVYSGYSDTGKGFYKVYSDVFDKIHANEINFAKKLGLGFDVVRQAPLMGNLDSPYAQATAFYNYWLGFSTVMDFFWVDEYDVMAGPNRKSRRLMEEENSKIRKRARKEYNETVRKLADFVKKRDKRVIDMKVKKNMEMEKKKEEERERKKQLEREKKERAMAYEEPEWAKVEDDYDEEDEASWFEEESKRKNAENEFYCVLCGKKFKSEKQWKNHEQSKKHKEKVAEFKDSLNDEEQILEDVEEGGKESLESDRDEIAVNDDNKSGNADYENEIDELEGRIRDGFDVAEEEMKNGVELSDEDDGSLDAQHVKDEEETGIAEGSDDDEEELGVLEAMLAGHKSRKTGNSRQEEPKAPVVTSQIENESDRDDGFMEYDSRKSSRKKRGAKKEKGRKLSEESKATNVNSDLLGKSNIDDDTSHVEESSSQNNVENESNGKENEQVGRDEKTANQPADRKGTTKDTKANAKNSSKAKNAKGKVTSKNLGNSCEACGEEFDSRNQLHKHLVHSGHATIKSTRKRR